MNPRDTTYRLSRFTQFLSAGERTIVANGMSLQRVVVNRGVADALRRFEGRSLDRASFAAESGRRPDEVRGFLDFFSAIGVLAKEGVDEEAALRRLARADAIEGDWRHDALATPFASPATICSYEVLARAGSAHQRLEPLRVVLLGGCALQAAIDALKIAGAERGFAVESSYAWPESDAGIAAALGHDDIVVVHPWVRSVVEPLFDEAHALDEAERQRRAQLLIDRACHVVDVVERSSSARLVLVHNLALPQHSPYGRFDFAAGFRACIQGINHAVADRCRRSKRAMLLDEESLFAAIGKRGVLDDDYAPFSHRAGMELLTSDGVPTSTFVNAFGATLAGEYLDCWLALSGARRIKCIVTDLDGTLWPGVSGEESFGWTFGGFTLGGHFEGLHQALRIAKARGALLATCSKNDETEVLRDWTQRARSAGANALRPEDFVLHKIGWRPKPDAIREIAGELGIGLDALFFLDDSPVEREAVRMGLPEVRIFDGPMHLARRALLSEPNLDARPTREASERTAMVRAQLERERARSSSFDPRSFLRSLAIRLRVRKMIDEDLDRVVEMFQRNNQFHTSLARLGPADFEPSQGAPAFETWVAEVEDRFTRYGIVGACVLAGGQVPHFTLSCRTIGLEIAVPFLVTVLRTRSAGEFPIVGRIVEGPRNEPCRRLFADAGFSETPAPGVFLLEAADRLASIDSAIFAIST